MAFLTVGDPRRLTGGYLYHREVFARWRARGLAVDELMLGSADLGAQLAAAPMVAEQFDPRPYTWVMVDALARAVCAPSLDRWRAQRPLVAMIHELPSVAGADTPAERAREAPLLRADAVIAVSADGAAILRARGVPAERITIASGGLDRLQRYRNPNPPVHLPEPARVLCVAQWIPRKGLLELATAWVATARAGWQLELVGENEADPAYAAAVHAVLAAAPPGSVLVRGPLSDAELALAYQRATLFAMPSHYEGYGIAFAEALFYGLPVLGCAVGPVPALVGPAGLLVAPRDQQALNAALAHLLEHAMVRQQLAQVAREQAASLPTWDQTAAQVLAALQAVASQ
ncbi:MAG: glycosyltransferase [Oscillochloridaceae bacterium umkhey_bin13]